MIEGWHVTLWVINVAVSAAIAVAGVRHLVERSRCGPLWLRLSLAAITVGAAANIMTWPGDIEFGQVALNSGVASIMVWRLRRRPVARG